MAYILRKSKTKSGTYLQVYYNFFDSKVKQPRNRYIKSYGSIEILKKKGIKNPTEYCKKLVDDLNVKENKKKDELKRQRISNEPVTLNLGYFLIKNFIDKFDIDFVLDIMFKNSHFQFKFKEMVRTLIYAQIIHPASKLKLSEEVIPSIYGANKYSEDQIYEALRFIGGDYKKFIELFNHEIGRKFLRKYNTLYFDCTNYFFEIDYEKEDKQKGPSKENRHSPIIGQALLLDSDGIPLAMEMYPGNQSEKPMIRKVIEDTKKRYGITGKTIQVADKGLNCAKNIYLAKKNYDGYIFSKSIRGRGLSDVEKKWILLDNGFKDINDENHKIKFRYKECIDFFDYKFIDEDGVEHKFKVKEKRVVSFNPSLAKKQIQEINKEIEKAKTLNSIKAAEKSEYGDAAKYVIFETKNKEGKVIKIQPKLNEDKILEDLKFAGYNLLVSSEYNLESLEIYNVYHNLSKIEESFRITKSVLEARPVNLQNRDEIYGHFTICFLSLLLLRFLEIKIFDKKVNSYDIANFVKSFQITKSQDDIFINNLKSNNKALNKINSILQFDKINYLYLNKSDIKEILKMKL